MEQRRFFLSFGDDPRGRSDDEARHVRDRQRDDDLHLLRVEEAEDRLLIGRPDTVPWVAEPLDDRPVEWRTDDCVARLCLSGGDCGFRDAELSLRCLELAIRFVQLTARRRPFGDEYADTALCELCLLDAKIGRLYRGFIDDCLRTLRWKLEHHEVFPALDRVADFLRNLSNARRLCRGDCERRVRQRRQDSGRADRRPNRAEANRLCNDWYRWFSLSFFLRGSAARRKRKTSGHEYEQGCAHSPRLYRATRAFGRAGSVPEMGVKISARRLKTRSYPSFL